MSLLLLLLLASLAVLAACGSSPERAAPEPSAPSADAPRTMTIVDDVGRTVDVSVPVRRVAVYNAFNVEFIRAVGAFERVVGIDQGAAGRNYAGYWGTFDASHTIGKGQAEPNYEELVRLDPEVVVIPRNGAWRDAVHKLEPFGIQVVVVTGWDLARHVFNVSLFGVLFDRQARAAELNRFYERYRDLLATRLADVPPERVYLENETDYSSPVPGSGWHDMIEAGGGTNIFGDIVFGSLSSPKGSVHDLQVDPEAIIAREPELIVKLTGGGYAVSSRGDLPAKAAELQARPGWADLAAVQDQRLVVTGSYPMNACSKIIGALHLAKWLHPEVMADVDPDAVMREWVQTYQGVALPDPAAYRLTTLG